MLAALAVNPVTYMVPLAAVMAALASRVATRTMEMGPRANAAIAMFILSTLAMGLWRFYGTIAAQTDAWQKGLLIDVLLYLLVLSALFPIRGRDAVTFCVLALALYAIGTNAESMESKQIAEAVQMCFIAALALQCFRLTPANDYIALILWGGLGAAEAFSAVLNLDCQFMHGMYGVREEGAACAQAWGVDLSLFLVAIFTAGFTWVLYRWYTPRRP